MSERKAVRARIKGRVQGVFFRGWTEDQANRLGLTGFVRNRKDGTVEALLAGPPDAVDEMLRLCWEGPPAAEVEAVETEEAEGVVPDRFDVKPTV